MNKGMFFGAGYQAINFLLLMVQAILLPRYLGLDLYGAGLLSILPILMLGGLWEPLVQRYCIGGDGIPTGWWVWGGLVVTALYSVYLLFLLSLNNSFIIILVLGVFFLLEYMLAIYFVAKFQANKQYDKIFFLSALGLMLCGVVFFFTKSSWLICFFYTVYFLPLLVGGLFFFRNDDKRTAVGIGVFTDVLDAISTRLFYVFINNFYVIIVGFFYGPAKAAVLKIVISLVSAFRFCNPYSIGHFYSLANEARWSQKLKLSMLPLAFFFLGVLVAWVLLPWVSDYGLFFLGDNYYVISGFLSSILLGVPFYLWSPYLTIVFFRVIGWLGILSICSASLLLSSVFLYYDSVHLFFIFACVLYSVLILSLGLLLELRLDKNSA